MAAKGLRQLAFDAVTVTLTEMPVLQLKKSEIELMLPSESTGVASACEPVDRKVMITSRTAQIPIDHMVAEVAAFPLASEAAFKMAIVELDDELDPPSGPLWREAERQIFGGFPAVSVEEAVGIRDKVWFAGRGRRVAMGEYLLRVARMFLEATGDAAVPVLPDAIGEREMLNIGPRAACGTMDLAVGFVRVATGPADRRTRQLSGPDDVKTVSPAVDRMLRDRGFAETHLHLGAGVSFSNLWVAVLHAIARPEMRPSAFRSPGPCWERVLSSVVGSCEPQLRVMFWQPISFSVARGSRSASFLSRQ